MRKSLILAIVSLLFVVNTNAEESKTTYAKLPDYTSKPFNLVNAHIEFEHYTMGEIQEKDAILVETYTDSEAKPSSTITVYYRINHTVSPVGHRPFGGHFSPIFAKWTSYADNKVRIFGFMSRVFDEFWYLKSEKDN